MDTATVTGDARASAPTRTGIGARIPAGGGRVLRAVGLVAGVGLAVLADRLGWWWVTPALGVAIGVFARRWWVPLWCLVAGLLVWGGDLAVQAAGGGIGRVARVTGALVGLGPDAGSTVVAVTVVFGVLLCLAGGWLGAAVRSLVRQTRRQPPQSSTVDGAETPAATPTGTPAATPAGTPVPALVLTTSMNASANTNTSASGNANVNSNPKEKLSHG